MSNFYYNRQGNVSHPNNIFNNGQQHPHQHHGGRSRRAHRQVNKAARPKEVAETINYDAYRREFEAAKGFDFEDDEIFCPISCFNPEEIMSMSSSASDRSSLSSGSPQQSPLQHQIQPQPQPTPSFVLSSAANFHPQSYTPTSYHQQSSYQSPQQQSTTTTKLHQPLAQRQLKAIPIVDPSTRAVASPPPSVSPARQMQQGLVNRRAW